jgi:hypothetical protein
MAGTDWKELELSSGVRILYGPFPHGLYWDIMDRALREHPDPDPPRKTINVLGGTEEVDDLEDPAYKADLERARLARYNEIGQAALDLCVEVVGWPDKWAATVDRLAGKYAASPPPDDPDERRVWFLTKYAIRTAQDWKVIGKIQRFSQIEEDDVRQRVESFPGDVAGAEGAGPDAPGAAA